MPFSLKHSAAKAAKSLDLDDEVAVREFLIAEARSKLEKSRSEGFSALVESPRQHPVRVPILNRRFLKGMVRNTAAANRKMTEKEYEEWVRAERERRDEERSARRGRRSDQQEVMAVSSDRRRDRRYDDRRGETRDDRRRSRDRDRRSRERERRSDPRDRRRDERERESEEHNRRSRSKDRRRLDSGRRGEEKNRSGEGRNGRRSISRERIENSVGTSSHEEKDRDTEQEKVRETRSTTKTAMDAAPVERRQKDGVSLSGSQRDGKQDTEEQSRRERRRAREEDLRTLLKAKGQGTPKETTEKFHNQETDVAHERRSREQERTDTGERRSQDRERHSREKESHRRDRERNERSWRRSKIDSGRRDISWRREGESGAKSRAIMTEKDAWAEEREKRAQKKAERGNKGEREEELLKLGTGVISEQDVGPVKILRGLPMHLSEDFGPDW